MQPEASLPGLNASLDKITKDSVGECVGVFLFCFVLFCFVFLVFVVFDFLKMYSRKTLLPLLVCGRNSEPGRKDLGLQCESEWIFFFFSTGRKQPL